MDRDKNQKQAGNQPNLPEAPASVTARVVSDHGFHLLFTLRDTTVSGLINKFDEFQKHVLARGWKPESRFESAQSRFTGKGQPSVASSGAVIAHGTTAPKENKPASQSTPAVCEVCGAPAVKKSGTRKDGTVWEGIFCSTGDESHKVWLS